MLTKEWLKSTRISLGLTQEDVAKRMSVTKQTISNIEMGKSTHKMAIAFYEKTLNEYLKDNWEI